MCWCTKQAEVDARWPPVNSADKLRIESQPKRGVGDSAHVSIRRPSISCGIFPGRSRWPDALRMLCQAITGFVSMGDATSRCW